MSDFKLKFSIDSFLSSDFPFRFLGSSVISQGVVSTWAWVVVEVALFELHRHGFAHALFTKKLLVRVRAGTWVSESS